jgi:hypothetical protein
MHYSEQNYGNKLCVVKVNGIKYLPSAQKHLLRSFLICGSFQTFTLVSCGKIILWLLSLSFSALQLEARAFICLFA